MNNRQIEVFAAVMKAGTVSRAAEVLGVTQPGVSRLIAELERTLGFALFARVRNRFVPTPEGRLFYDEVEASFRGMDQLRATAARIRDYGAGQLRVATLSALSSSIVPNAVKRFRTARPDAAVTLMVLPSRDVRNGVASGAFDVGLAADEIDVSGVVHQVFVQPRALCAIPLGHPLAARETIGPHDLSGVDFVAYVPEDRARQRFDHILREAGAAPPHVVVETIYAATVFALVSEGVGVGLVSPYAIAGHDQSRIVLRPFEPAVHSRSLLILPPDRPKSQLVRDFIDCLMEAR
ncbi:MAG: LysR family transcriptional regulator [Chelatococcus sp.]|nr:MAG: LysR family transcriptional regulator [Chelatococcus sp.]